MFLGCYTFSHTCQLALDPEFLCGPKVVGWGAYLVTTLEGPHSGKLELWIGGFIVDKKNPGNVETAISILRQQMSLISPQLTSNPN